MGRAVGYLGTTTQRSGESIAYTVDTSNVGGSPSVNSVAIYDHTDFSTDLAGTNLSGSASVSSDVITTPLVTGLTAGSRYRVEVNFDSGGETFEDYFDITCDDDE